MFAKTDIKYLDKLKYQDAIKVISHLTETSMKML
jgi:hypothetical protein